MADTFIGTCSWTDRPLLEAGTFYPATAKTPEARLRFYASVFPTVEVDSSFYGIPKEDTARLWVERTPSAFKFHVKMFRLLTFHWTEPKVIPENLRHLAPPDKKRFYLKEASEELRSGLLELFRSALLPLHRGGKLGVVLLQFPKWVLPKRENFDHILSIKEALPEFQLAVEFRNQSWLLEGRQEKTLS